MRLRGATEYQRQMARSTAVTTEYGVAAERAGVQAKSGAAGINMMSASAKKGVGALGNLRKAGSKMRSTGRTLTTGLSLPLAAVGYLSVKTAGDFERSMAQVEVAIGGSGKKIEMLSDLSKEMGAESKFSANEAAEAVLELAKNGMKPAQIQAGALKGAIDLAAAGNIGLAESATLTGTTLTAFNLKGSKAASVADALAGGANASAADVSDLAMALSQGGTSAASYGLNINEAVGALAAFADNSIRGSDAGTSFKTFLMRLNPQTKKAAELMDSLGLRFFDAQGNMKKLPAIAGELKSKLDGLTQKDRNKALGELFGSDAIRAANVFYKEGTKGIEKYIGATQKQGAASKMASAFMKGMAGTLEKSRGAMENASLAAGVALAPVIITLAGGVEWLAEAFSSLPEPVQKGIVFLGVGLAALGPIIFLVGALTTAVGGLGVALTFLAANPIALVVIAAAAAFTLLYLKVGWFHDAVDSVVGFIKANWKPLAAILLFPLSPFLAITVAVVSHLDWLKNAFNNVVGFFRRLPGRIMSGLAALPHLFGALVAKALVFWATLPVRIAQLQWKMVTTVVSITMSLGPKLLSIGAQVMAKMAVGVAHGAGALFEFFTALPGKLASLIGHLASKFFDIGKNIASEIAKGFYDNLPGPLKDALGAAGEGLNTVKEGVEFVNPFASGTTFAPGGIALVGEMGPELVNLPRGAEVWTASQTRRATASGEATVRPLRSRGGPTPIKLDASRQNGAYKRTVRHEVKVPVEFKVGRRKFGEAMAMAMIDEEVNE
jgi:TP901 family phage tail tape measure protein